MTDTFDIDGFRNAAPYINAHRGHCCVIAFGGEALDQPGFPSLMHDFALLHSLGVKLVLVHGARPQIERRLQQQGMEWRYVEGLRLTDTEALPCVCEAVGRVRTELESLLSMGLVNTPMSGLKLRVASGNYVTAKPLGVRGGIDFGHTGEVRKVDGDAIRAHLELGDIVLLSPLGYSPTGEIFNLSAEEVATAVASALHAHKLVLMLEGAQPPHEVLGPLLDLQQARARLDNGTGVPDSLRRSVEHAVQACAQGVARAHLLSRAMDGVLLRELYTRDGVGAMITAETYEGLRDANIEDVGGILELIAPLEAAGVLVRRSREQLELEISRFVVVERDGMIIGCAALYPYSEDGVGELACLATHPNYQRTGRARALLEHVEQRALALGLSKLLVLTTQTGHWFRERGFERGELSSLPVKRRQLYNYQRNSQVYVKLLRGK